MHWMAWWKMCVLKSQGGMGFHVIPCFNMAMLAIQASSAWRKHHRPRHTSRCIRTNDIASGIGVGNRDRIAHHGQSSYRADSYGPMPSADANIVVSLLNPCSSEHAPPHSLFLFKNHLHHRRFILIILIIRRKRIHEGIVALLVWIQRVCFRVKQWERQKIR